MAFTQHNESHNSSHLPEVMRERPMTLREAVESMGETQQIVGRKVRLHQESEIRALGQNTNIEASVPAMPSDAAFEAAAEQIAAEATAVYEAEKIVDSEAVRLTDAQRAVEEALNYEAAA